MRKSETSVEHVKRRHKSLPTSNSPARKKSTVNINLQCVQPRSLLRQREKENLLPAELQIHDDLVVPVKPKKNITSSIEVRQSKILLRKT